MNFEEFETSWSQQPNPAATIDTASLQRTVDSLVRRRGRLLTYQITLLAFVLLVYPILSVANFRYLHPASPWLFWLSVALHGGFFIAFLAYGVRRLKRHRANQRQRAASVREYAAVAFAGVDAEMRETRAGRWLLPLFAGLAILSGYANNMTHYTPQRFAQQIIVIAIIILPIASALWRDYRVNLQPARERLRAILASAE